MVTLLKDYEQQTYFLNSWDDIDGIAFKNGDQVFLMDQDLLLIYDEGNDNWQPVPTGGGGGEQHPYITYTEYEQAADWTTDAQGNSANFFATYCNSGAGPYFFGIKHVDDTDQYRGVRGYGSRQYAGSNSASFYRGNNSWVSTIGTSTSFHIEAGATIGVWHTNYDTAWEDYV